MHRVIAAFRLLHPKAHRAGPLRPSSDGVVPAEDVGEFLNGIYIAVEKLRAFGFADETFGGDIEIVEREEGEKANGRYLPKEDKVRVFNPPERGAPDFLWTIIHEVMHRVWVKHIDEHAKKVWGALCFASGKEFDPFAAEALAKVVEKNPDKSSLWFYFNKHFGDDLGLFKLWLKTRRVSASFPSQYASAEPAEAFSEVAANVILGRGHAGREIKRSGSMVRKVFLCMVGPLRDEPGSELTEDVLLEQQDENFLQTQVDFGYLRITIPRWIVKNVSEDDILKLEHRPHATVYYGADKRDIAGIQKAVEDYGRPIRVSLGALNLFEHEEHDVLYVELVGDSLFQLHNKIAELPYSRPQTHPKYIPHLTLAYLKKGTGRKFVGLTPFHRVVSARGLTIIDASGIEKTFRALPDEAMNREPLLLAGL